MLAFYYHPLMLFVWGICWGSFFNVVFYRFPLGRSVVHPGSACPSCRQPIAMYDNIPIFSWLILRGKCRHCKTPYSAKYLFVEAFFGMIAAAPYWIYPQQYGAGLWLSSLLLTLTPTVILFVKHRKAPWYLILASLITISGYAIQLARI